jgi:hypothetical protein
MRSESGESTPRSTHPFCVTLRKYAKAKVCFTTARGTRQARRGERGQRASREEISEVSSVGSAARKKEISGRRAKKPTTRNVFLSISRGAKFVEQGGDALAPRQQPPLNRSELHGQAVQHVRDLPSSHPRALQPREERDVRGRAPHPCEMMKRAIANERGEGTVSARSRSGRDRARVARAEGGRSARDVREGLARRYQ